MARKFCDALKNLSTLNSCHKRNLSSAYTFSNCKIPTKTYNISIEYKHQPLTFSINTVKVGHGPRAVFILPGVLGSMEVQLMSQITKFDKDKFTIYSWDQSGYGNSRSIPRNFNNEALEQDVRLLVEMLKKFGHEKWSLLGWSGGGNIAILTAIGYPELIDHLVVWGAFAQVRKEDAETFKWFRNVDNWGGLMKKTLVEFYGEEFFRQNWSIWMDIFISYYTERGGNFCSIEELQRIQCPTFIIHGDEDKLVHPYHGKYLHQHIKNSKFYSWPGGKHNVHLRHSEKFNRLVQEFLSHDLIPH